MAFIAVIIVMTSLYQEIWFRCREFDARYVDTSEWHRLSDNYEAATLTLLSCYLFCTCMGIYAVGSARKGLTWFMKPIPVLVFAAALGGVVYLHTQPPHWLKAVFRVECGEWWALLRDGYTGGEAVVKEFFGPLKSNAFPAAWRMKLFTLCCAITSVILTTELLLFNRRVNNKKGVIEYAGNRREFQI